ncbi:hypothetical protein [Hymenobacter cheonanensis]|uniref:hypothetical protein n=1 Tax=Hymenobacter sp. CA2-7 TaxID=3063993 RepID=UPI002712FEEA|nr:hypothetical protein [Hymenobacter sp. CA2-7]MDO7886284.1 hypothetical protein [Hymenobacter sp. CA2-7]
MLSPTPISTHLSVEHRAFVALYALQIGQLSRQAILSTYDVTDADLAFYHAAWLELQANHADRNRPISRISLSEDV